ncbi:hypothetical protein ACMU_07850 [Actibacterium mucosum KCTC 23349]|uniref:Membrane protein 6-pyruvoyl-tetrahydropterin synthase-related domain-containing protein n=1 Tax=Actibacterium mucosum KCTC 23349 TaxID=1454373 RepID=A0A037ZMQ8_9RHOB|nr:hypothetical protein [Actibacterium mucosum]KAJ56843.1 hypothetical protein ACMU_07850 [Actibacterium mucosum KCTC 23349]
MQQVDDTQDGMRLLLAALAAAVLFHGGLLPFTHGNTYDAYIHMFFADSYHRSWFDPWEPRWYTGFATTSYPPGTHMAIGGLMHLMPLRAAFVVVQLLGLLLLVVGVYRFSLLWVTARPAGFAALSLVVASSISETIHLFGQLPTIFSLGVFLNGLPYVYRWIVAGRWIDLALAVIFAAATTAAHHVTTIFGGVLFILPLGLHALRGVVAATSRDRMWRVIKALGRGVLLAAAMLSAIVVTVLPYWIWSVSDPITQVSIPHGSRENFLVRRDLGFIFFLLPWGTALLVLPYALWKTATTRLWPLGVSVLLCFILGTGGTTPISRAILGGAFDILTLDRFTFWATILILPFTGYLLDGLLRGGTAASLRSALGRGFYAILLGSYFAATVGLAVFAAILPTIQPTQPRHIDPAPIVKFMAEDNHDRWRYLTLGFGDQFAYLSAQTAAQSVDGNYHSARRLSNLTRYSVERLENAKYLGVPGLGSLKQFLVNAEDYHLKFTFSNDAFYDPLLHFTGWVRLTRLSNGVTVWERPDISPLPALSPRRHIPELHMLMWGLIPPGALLLALAVFAISVVKRSFGAVPGDPKPVLPRSTGFRNARLVFWVVTTGVAAVVVLTIGTGLWVSAQMRRPVDPQQVIAAYFDALDFRRFEAAFARLDPVTRPDFDTAMFNWRWRGGLIASYGKLTDIRATPVAATGDIADWRVELDWLTALDVRTETMDLRLVRRDGHWYLLPLHLRPVQTPQRLQRGAETAWNLPGRRQPRPETDLHRDRLDRPEIALSRAQLVEHDGRYNLVGLVYNQDADPAYVSVFGDLLAGNTRLARTATAQIAGQQLLPLESTGFRVAFEGVLSLDDAATAFDPTLFIPPQLSAPPDDATLSARALVTTQGLYRGVALNGVQVTSDDGRPEITGLAVNTGNQPASITRIVVLAYDMDGAPVWAEAGFVETNIYPGQSAPFHMTLPARKDLRVIARLGTGNQIVNGATPGPDATAPVPPEKIMVDIPGYAALHLYVSSMTYDPLF